jgi:long-subunit acyl-CoA synthetase (AMP-forming)
LTHDNLIFDICAWLQISRLENDGRMMSYLPMAHLADRVFAHYVSMLTGGTITCVDDAKAAVPAIADTHPTLWLGVPRVWEKLKASLEAQFAGEPDPARRAAIEKAIETSIERVRLEQAGQVVPDALRHVCEIADAEILSGVRARLGFDSDPYLLSGAAPIPLDVLEFFAALGLPINEGYGMTECSAVTTLNCPGARRYGTVGRALPGVEVSLADDGELLTRGRLVMPGYRKAPDKTAEAIDADGWFHTGDVAAIDDDGFVRIVDRKKELIINAAGKNMSPANIEEKLKSASPLIGIAVAIGDSRPYNTALIVLEPEAATVFARAHGISQSAVEALASDPQVQAAVAEGVELANERMSRVEQIKKHTILAGEWLPGGEELTPTLKLKRKPIAAKYTAEIEAMY